MIKKKSNMEIVPITDFSTTATIREDIETLADEPVIISVPIGGDASEFE